MAGSEGLKMKVDSPVPPSSNTSLGYSAVRGFIPHGTLYCFTGVQRVQPQGRTVYCAVGENPTVRTLTINSYDWR